MKVIKWTNNVLTLFNTVTKNPFKSCEEEKRDIQLIQHDKIVQKQKKSLKGSNL